MTKPAPAIELHQLSKPESRHVRAGWHRRQIIRARYSMQLYRRCQTSHGSIRSLSSKSGLMRRSLAIVSSPSGNIPRQAGSGLRQRFLPLSFLNTGLIREVGAHVQTSRPSPSRVPWMMDAVYLVNRRSSAGASSWSLWGPIRSRRLQSGARSGAGWSLCLSSRQPAIER